MPVDPSLVAVAARVGAFHITDRAMRRAQSAIESAIATGTIDDATRVMYLREVKRYFKAFDREAREQLRDVDRRLERTNQIQFNLTAERGVAVKRIEGTQGVLEALASLDGTAS